MCESKIVLFENGKRSVVMETAAKVTFTGNDATCTDITGEEKTVKGVKVREMNLMKHEIILQRGR
jgi:predicted RNA-binding protein